jgi:hypothetical protein
MVVNFSHPTATHTQIKNKWQTEYLPDLRDYWGSQLTEFTNLSYRIKVGLKQIDGGQEWQAYPKICITGDTDLSGATLKAHIDEVTDKVKAAVKNKLEADGVTILGWHIHMYDGGNRDNV